MNILYINNIMEVGGVEKCIIQLSKLMNDNCKVIVASAGGTLVEELVSYNVKHYKIENTDNKNPINVMRNLIKIYRIIKKENIDLVHSHHRMTTLYCKILKKVIKFKLVHTQHLCIEDKVKLTRIALNKIPIITVSDGAKENLINIYKLQDKYITTIYNTIETKNNNYEIDDRLLKLKDEKAFIVAHISRLVEYKGVYDFIEIAKKVSKKQSNIKFVIIGDGEERDSIENIIKANELEESIFLLGNKNNVINQLDKIDLVLLCSYIEGLPLTPLEALYKGIPVIATNIKGTNEEIVDGYCGYLLEIKDIDGFADKIIELYNDSNKYSKLKENCTKRFDLLFSKEKYAENHKAYYKSIMNK